MTNDLLALTESNRTLFKHAFILLPWFLKNSDAALRTDNYLSEAAGYIEAIKEDAPSFFGNWDVMQRANELLDEFYKSLSPTGKRKANSAAIEYYKHTWQAAWYGRGVLQLRGNEMRLMKYFYKVICRGKYSLLGELISMARLIDGDVIKLVRKIHLPNGWTPRRNLREINNKLQKCRKKLLGSKKAGVKNLLSASKKKPKTYKTYQALLRDRIQAARLRIAEIYDFNGWKIVDADMLRPILKKQGLGDLLPKGFKGRIGIQPSGYPLTFHTYAGLELDKPPLHKVTMNKAYGKEVPQKDYSMHPIADGTFYCCTKAVVGKSITKYYTLDYKRRARIMKYRSVSELAKVIDRVREQMLTHVNSDDRDTWVRALACMFIDFTCARVGNVKSSSGRSRTYGVTTLRTKEHVKLTLNEIVFSYQGKHNQPQRHVIRNIKDKKNSTETIIYEKLRELVEEGGEYVFTRSEGRPYTPRMINEYFTSKSANTDNNLPFGGADAPCTVHNLRNYHATRMFKDFAREFQTSRIDAEYEEVLAAYRGSTAAGSTTTGILESIAKRLGNTAAICRKAYVDPSEQIRFFTYWGYRPPDMLINDLHIDLQFDVYSPSADLSLIEVPVPVRNRTL